MPTSRTCTIAACATAAISLFASACSSGGGAERVSTDSHSTTSVAESTTTAGNHQTGSVTVTTGKAGGRAAGRQTTATTPSAVTVVTSGAVQTIDTTPATAAPTTPRTNPPAPPTTVPGPKPYDPTKPIDLGGEPGVTPAQQARAEKLVRDTLRDTKKYLYPSAAYADGYRSIGDAGTGDEHYVKWAYDNDGHILESKRPESLVYEVHNGKQTLAAAMYSLPPGSTFADVPDVGGALTQWHVHDDLCLADSPSDPLRKVVSSVTTVNGKCPPGSSKLGSAPMIHVWVIANACGPFAALEGIGAGQVPPGQTRLCDTGHGI